MGCRFISRYCNAVDLLHHSGLLITGSVARERRPRRLWICGFWTLIVAGFATLRLSAAEWPSNQLGDWLEDFAYPWLFWLLIALWMALLAESRFARE